MPILQSSALFPFGQTPSVVDVDDVVAPVVSNHQLGTGSSCSFLRRHGMALRKATHCLSCCTEYVLTHVSFPCMASPFLNDSCQASLGTYSSVYPASRHPPASLGWGSQVIMLCRGLVGKLVWELLLLLVIPCGGVGVLRSDMVDSNVDDEVEGRRSSRLGPPLSRPAQARNKTQKRIAILGILLK